MTRRSTATTAEALLAPGKGLLAADESTSTMAERFASVHVTANESVRRSYRDVLFRTPGLSEHVSGVILHPETIHQRSSDDQTFAELIGEAGMLPGVAVDTGTRALAGFPGEVVTEGLDGLRGRLSEYVALGARFASWRSVVRIGQGRPSSTCVEVQAQALARFAALAQEAGLTAVLGAGVLNDGPHSVERCGVVTATLLRAVFDQLARHRVRLEGTLLQTSMVLPGTGYHGAVTDEAVAEATLSVLRSIVPVSVPGITFVTGGQSPEQATARLNALARLGPQPWELTFAFGRTLQFPALQAWGGVPANFLAMQETLAHRTALAGAARRGSRSDMEVPATGTYQSSG